MIITVRKYIILILGIDLFVLLIDHGIVIHEKLRVACNNFLFPSLKGEILFFFFLRKFTIIVNDYYITQGCSPLIKNTRLLT